MLNFLPLLRSLSIDPRGYVNHDNYVSSEKYGFTKDLISFSLDLATRILQENAFK